MLNIKGLK